MWRAGRPEGGCCSADVSKRHNTHRGELHRLVQAWSFVAVFIVTTSWATVGVAAAESSLAAQDVVTKGTVEVGGAIGYAQGTTAIGHAQSANRSAVFVMPRIGMVLTDPLGKSWWKGNVELLVEPMFARFVQPFAAEAAGGSFVLNTTCSRSGGGCLSGMPAQG